MDDDFGTPQAVAVLFELAREIGRGRAELAPQLRALGGVLGLLQRDAEAFLKWQPPQPGNVDGVYQVVDAESIEKLIRQRDEARSRRDYAEADRIRADLEARGILLEDSANVTTWRRS
jgi:cysteinyl-tRNA synthetase